MWASALFIPVIDLRDLLNNDRVISPAGSPGQLANSQISWMYPGRCSLESESANSLVFIHARICNPRAVQAWRMRPSTVDDSNWFQMFWCLSSCFNFSHQSDSLFITEQIFYMQKSKPSDKNMLNFCFDSSGSIGTWRGWLHLWRSSWTAGGEPKPETGWFGGLICADGTQGQNHFYVDAHGNSCIRCRYHV